jgi:cell division septation protein DedD
LPKNDEGEFELILGNRQLISVFLIVVVLLGLFFSMGYVVGRNSSPTAAPETARADKPSGDSHPPDPAATDSSSSAAPVQPLVNAAPDDSAPATTPPSITTHPEKPAPLAEKPKASKEAKAKPSPAREPASPPERASVASQPPGGQYWQVVATARPDAEIIAEALAKKGFHAVLSPAPKDGVFRVLVGPLPDAPTQALTRTNLEAAGFKNPIMRKY